MKEREIYAADAATLDQREAELLSELEEMPVKLEEAYQSLFNLRFRQATRQLEDTSQLGKARKEIARLKTADREMRFELAVIDAARNERAS